MILLQRLWGPPLVHLIVGGAIGGLAIRRGPPDVLLGGGLAHDALVARAPPCLCARESRQSAAGNNVRATLELQRLQGCQRSGLCSCAGVTRSTGYLVSLKSALQLRSPYSPLSARAVVLSPCRHIAVHSRGLAGKRIHAALCSPAHRAEQASGCTNRC